MEIGELTLNQIREIAKLAQHPACASSPYEVGQSYLIRTVTNYWTGHVVSVEPSEIVIEDAAWIADTGRFSDALRTGKLNEVEPVDGPVIISRVAVVDAVMWHHELPREQK